MITVTVDENSINQSGKSCGVCGEGNSREMTVIFKDDWLDYSKRIIFYNARGGNPVCVLFTETNQASGNNWETHIIRIPSEPLKYSGEIEYVIQGYTTLTDNTTAVAKSECGYMTVSYAPPETEFDVPADVTPDQAAQLQMAIDTASTAAKEYTDDKDAETNKRIDTTNKNLENAEASIRRDFGINLTDECTTIREEIKDTLDTSKKYADQKSEDALSSSKEYTDGKLTEKADKTELPTKVSELENDTKYMKETEYPRNIYLLGEVSSLEELQSISNENRNKFTENSGAVVRVTADINGELKLYIPGGPAVLESVNLPAFSYLMTGKYGWILLSKNFDAELAEKADRTEIPVKLSDLSDDVGYAKKTDIANVYKYKGEIASAEELAEITTPETGDTYNVSVDISEYADNLRIDIATSGVTDMVCTFADDELTFEAFSLTLPKTVVFPTIISDDDKKYLRFFKNNTQIAENYTFEYTIEDRDDGQSDIRISPSPYIPTQEFDNLMQWDYMIFDYPHYISTIKKGDNIAWNGTEWDNLSGIVDLTEYAKKSDVPTRLGQLYDDMGYVKDTDIVGINQKIIDTQNDLSELEKNVALKTELPAKVSDLENDEGYVKNTDVASYTKLGLVQGSGSFGFGVNQRGVGFVQKADNVMIDARTDGYHPIVPSNLDYAVRSVLPLTADAVPSVLAANTEYYLGETAELTFAFPTAGELGQYCFVKFDSGETAANLTVSGNNFAGDIPTPKANTTYEIIATWNGSKWVSSYRGY